MGGFLARSPSPLAAGGGAGRYRLVFHTGNPEPAGVCDLGRRVLGWDPVENLMPWLTATALVHSVVMLRRRHMFLVWTVILVAISFLLTIFGTFLTRSGIATSVHAFSDNTFIPWFTFFLLIAIIFSVAVMVARRSELKSEKRLDDLFSRESAFLYTNVVLVVIASWCWSRLPHHRTIARTR
jgi:cytochrome c biogenesis factor